MNYKQCMFVIKARSVLLLLVAGTLALHGCGDTTDGGAGAQPPEGVNPGECTDRADSDQDGECSDGVDNDGDDEIDCESGGAPSRPTAIPGRWGPPPAPN